MKAHLVDGTYELFRAFFGAPPATDRNGREVGATRGLMRSMASLLDQPGVTHVAAAFDTVIESFRNELYGGYKTGDGLPAKLTDQFPLAERALAAMGITVWGMIDFEADDAIATAAHRLAMNDAVDQVVLCSPDKDLTQCVIGDRVVVLDRMRKKQLDEAGVIEKFGVAPASIPDWLALVGDTADGYPGIPRWGAKSAATVLCHYRHLDAIPDRARDWQVKVRGSDALAENLAAQRKDAELFRTLATLRRDVPIDASLARLAWSGPKPELASVCAELDIGPGLREELERRAARA
jgi:5'-3' exonuclease